MSQPYDQTFFDAQSNDSLVSARKVLGLLFKSYQPNSVADFGCGIGTWVLAAQEFGISDVTGVDGHWVERDKLLIEKDKFLNHDLNQPLNLGRCFDLVISVEVAEHLAPKHAETFVNSLTQHSKLILFSAALPFQGGIRHLNENWLEYWAQIFLQANFEPLDILRPKLWNDPSIAWWYRQNCVMFRSYEARNDILPDVKSIPIRSFPHPEFLLRAIRRKKVNPIKTNLQEDLDYYTSITTENRPEVKKFYGNEFDYYKETNQLVESYSELKTFAQAISNPILSDALTAIKPRTTPLTPLVPATIPPDFICIGVQRAATTWLYQLFRTHPQIQLVPLKDINFFSRRTFEPGYAYNVNALGSRVDRMIRNYAEKVQNINPKWLHLLTHLYKSGVDGDWYEEIFRFYHNPSKIQGDISVDYAMLTEPAIKELKTFAPDAKIIIILRDPIERVLSQLLSIAVQVPQAKPFVDDLAHEPSTVERSHFEQIVPRWTSHFEPSQLVILTQSSIKNEPSAVILKLGKALNINSDAFNLSRINAAVFVNDLRAYFSQETIDFLKEEFKETYRFLYSENLI